MSRKVIVPSLSPTNVPTLLLLRTFQLLFRGNTCVEIRSCVVDPSGATGRFSEASWMLVGRVKCVMQGTFASKFTPLSKKVTLLGVKNVLTGEQLDKTLK